MTKDLSGYRKTYDKSRLRLEDCESNPIKQFRKWFNEVETSYPDIEVNAMTLSTVDSNGHPRGRVVLLKELSDHGFIFYTNYHSQKGEAIKHNSSVCLSFFWEVAQRQVIIKGQAEKVSREKSERYFHSRPRGSQIGAYVSNQSEVIASTEELSVKVKETEKKFAGQEIPLPDDWGGYEVKPFEIEFWQGRPNRLHDRIRYSFRKENEWQLDRLSP